MRTIQLLLIIYLLLSLSITAADDPNKAFFDAVNAGDAATVNKMLDRDPSLLNAKRPSGASVVTAALFVLVKGEGFIDPPKNAVLQAVLARKPKFDMYETAALGTTEQLSAVLRDDPGALNRRNRFGWTMLHMAAFAGNAPTTQLLLDKGATVDVRADSKFRNTPLQTALLTGQYATAKLLLDRGADVLIRQSKGFTPMHEAAFLGRADLVQLLLDHGAELNSRSDGGRTPLGEAIRGKHEELAKLLKEKGAQVEEIKDGE